jgi:hypothetical protein
MTIAAVCLLIGISIIGAMSGYTAKRGAAPLWIGLPLIAAIGLMMGGSAGLAWTVASALVGQNSSVGYFALGLGLFALTVWATSIAVQFSQNFFYRIVGAPTQRIRWWRDEPRRRRNNKMATKRS